MGVDTGIEQMHADDDICSTTVMTEASCPDSSDSMHVTEENGKPAQDMLAESTGVQAQKLVKHSTLVLLDESEAEQIEEDVEPAQETLAESAQYKSKRTAIVYLDETDEVQIEEDESFELRSRGAGGCGCCAQQSDTHFSLLCGLISCDVQANAGVSYCRSCC